MWPVAINLTGAEALNYDLTLSIKKIIPIINKGKPP
jgi:hypothetical protein